MSKIKDKDIADYKDAARDEIESLRSNPRFVRASEESVNPIYFKKRVTFPRLALRLHWQGVC